MTWLRKKGRRGGGKEGRGRGGGGGKEGRGGGGGGKEGRGGEGGEGEEERRGGGEGGEGEGGRMLFMLIDLHCAEPGMNCLLILRKCSCANFSESINMGLDALLPPLSNFCENVKVPRPRIPAPCEIHHHNE